MFFFNSETDFKSLDKESQIETFRKNAKTCVDYICEYTSTVQKRPIFPSVEPGYLRKLLPPKAPEEPEDFKQMLDDFDKFVMPGIMHWKHPDFYAYFNCGNSLPNILGDMLSTGCGGVGFSWTAQPALTELENVMLDWYGRALNLPSQFIFEDSKGKGGGCTQASASDSIFSVVVSARHVALKANGCYQTRNSTSMEDHVHPAQFLAKLICYTSREAHSCVEKAANVAMVEIRILCPDQHFKITGEILERAIIEDEKDGRIPFLFIGTIGSTGCAAVDDLQSIGPVCKKHNLWFHVDAAYGGSAFLLPEKRHLLNGLEYLDSIDVNPYKLMLGAIDSGCLWLRDVTKFKQPWLIDAVYLIDEYDGETDVNIKTNEIDYRHYGIPLSRRMRALKLYFIFRSYGISGLRAYVRRVIKLAKLFESLIRSDDRFVITSPASLGVICFRQKGKLESMVNFNCARSDYSMSYSNRLNMNLLYRINNSKKIHMCPYILRGQYTLRLSVNHEFATESDIRRAWQVIQSFYVTSLDPEWDTTKSGTPTDAKTKRLKSQMSFVNVVPSGKLNGDENKNTRLPLSFGSVSVSDDFDL